MTVNQLFDRLSILKHQGYGDSIITREPIDNIEELDNNYFLSKVELIKLDKDNLNYIELRFSDDIRVDKYERTNNS